MAGKSKESVKAMALLREELLKWLCIKHATNSTLSRATLKDTAFDFIRTMNLRGNFKCSESWVTLFLKRHGFSPALDSDDGPKMDDWSKWVDLVRGLIDQYPGADQYHLDELTLYTDFANDTPPGSSSMQQMTVLLACNATGTDKLKPLICGANAVRESEDFTYARSCVLTDESLAIWLQKLNTRLMENGRSILVFLSRTRINVVKLTNLTHILLVFYPLELPDTAKPLRRDIFNFVKMEYRKAYVERLIDVRNHRWTFQEVVEALVNAWKRLPQHFIIFRFSETRYRIDGTMLAPSCPDFDRLELGVPFTTFITFDDHLSYHGLQAPTYDPHFLMRLKRHHSQLKLTPEASQADEEPAAGSSGQNGGTDSEPVTRVIETQDGVEGRIFITNSMAGTSVVAGEPQENGIQENSSGEPSGSGFQENFAGESSRNQIQQNFTGENVNYGLSEIIPLHNNTNNPGEDSDVIVGETTAGEGFSSESTMTAPVEYSEENSAGKSLENVSQEQIPDLTSEERCQTDVEKTPSENMSISEAGSEIPGCSTIPVLENNARGEIPGNLELILGENSGVGLNENSSLENNCPGNSPARVDHSPALFPSYFTSSTPGDQKTAPKHRFTPFPTRIPYFSLNSEDNNLENDPPANRRLFSPGKSDSDMENSRNTSLIIDEVNVTLTDEIPRSPEKSIVIPSTEVFQEIPASAVEICVKTLKSPGENENSSEEEFENSVENSEEYVDCYEHFDEKPSKYSPVQETPRETFDSPSDNDESSLKNILMLKPKKSDGASLGKSSPAKLNEEPDEKSSASSPVDEDVKNVENTPKKRIFSPIFGLEDKQSSGELAKYSPETAVDSLEAPSNLPEIEGSPAEQVFSSIFAEKSQRLDNSAASTPIHVRETAFQEASRELEEKLTALEANDPDRRFPGDYDDDGSTAETMDTDSLFKDLLSETESPEFRGFPEDSEEQCYKGSKRLRVDDENEIGDRKRMKLKNSDGKLDNYYNFGDEQNVDAAAQKRFEENESSEPAAGCSYNKY